MVLNKYIQAKEEANRALGNARKELKAVFSSEAQELLKELGIETFSWTQYTPYWNDGDVCYFSVNTWWPKINKISEDSFYYGSYEDEEGVTVELTEEEKARLDAAREDVKRFLEQFDDDDMQWLFGDHVEVTVTKYGIIVEEYYHD